MHIAVLGRRLSLLFSAPKKWQHTCSQLYAMINTQRTLGALFLLTGLLLLPAAASADSFLNINDTLPNGVVNLSWGQGPGLCPLCTLTSVFVNGQGQALQGSLDFTDGTLFTFNGSWTVPQGGYFGNTSGTAYFFDQTDPNNTSDILQFPTQGSQDGF